MKRKLFARGAILAAAIVLIAGAFGCSKQSLQNLLVPNQRPTVDLTAAPVSIADTAWYSYRINWSGNDADGRVDHFQYAIDAPTAPDSDTLWVSTTKNEQQLFFRATTAYYSPKRGWRGNDFHRFVIRAVDNVGAVSAPKSRAFFSYTVAPVVTIFNPQPSALLQAPVTPAVRINWKGTDEDGVFTQRPIQYKYKLFREGNPEYDFIKLKREPDSLRAFYAARNFAGWDSVGGDTTFVQYTGLTPGSSYVFVVIGIDEAGAYSPDFSLVGNMLQFVPGFAGTLGPSIIIFNEFFFYQYSSGGVSIDPLAWINIEVPAGQRITFNWFALPPPGALIEWYKWKLDGDIFDESGRTNETNDWYHWSRKSNLTFSCTVGPFPGGEEHFFYMMTQDNNNLPSLAVVHFKVVAAALTPGTLLVVDDTRLEPDKFPSGPVPARYTTPFPSAAELDTFLFARGGSPWKGPNGVPPTTLPPSRRGVFGDLGFQLGRDYDTLGTRQGYELASAGVPFSVLGRYQNLIWMTDIVGATSAQTSTSTINPLSTLKWMCDIGRSSTLSTYWFAGGRLWLLGGSSGYCSLIAFNAKSAKNNDGLYGPGKTVFSNTALELIPGRLIYDGVKWQSEMVTQLVVTTPVRYRADANAWTNPGRGYIGSLSAPDYSRLPASLRKRSLALGDSLPPTRSTQANFYYTNSSTAVEYLTQDNFIIEDIDSDPLVENPRSVLDSMMVLQGGQLATAVTEREPICMTYYHGVQAPQFVFSGFDIWSWSRQDIEAMVNFVIHDIWGLTPSGPAPSFAARSVSQGAQPASTVASRPGARLPSGRGGNR